MSASKQMPTEVQRGYWLRARNKTSKYYEQCIERFEAGQK